jgi:D-tyrosyl-tRNA(Tyr) deacylase
VRAVAQRVTNASVTVSGEVVGRIDAGLLVYLGVGRDDGEADVAWMVQKLAGLRVFEDEHGKMSRSVRDAGGQLLLVSQFTLFGDVRRGLRPSFDDAAPPERAVPILDAVRRGLEATGLVVATGRFRAEMVVRADVMGPVTILLDSKKTF